MKKIVLILVLLTVVITATMVPIAAYSWTATNYSLITIGDYHWYNYDFDGTPASSTTTDWPIAVIFYGPSSTVDNAKNTLWSYIGWALNAVGQRPNGTWFVDTDSGKKSASNDGDAYHARVYADTTGDRCTKTGWPYYVIATAHHDYKDYPAYEYFGDTNYAAANVVSKAGMTVGYNNCHSNFFNTMNAESWRREGTSEPYHVWDWNGVSYGIYLQ